MKVDSLPLVLITNSVPPNSLSPLDGLAQVVMGPTGGDLMTRAEVLAHASQLRAIINQGELRVDEELLAAAPQLQIVANVAMGVDNLDLAMMRDRGVIATNVPDAFVESTADCTLALLLALSRRIPEADRFVRAAAWRSFRPGTWDGVLLRGKTLGLVGYGQIARAVETRAKAFGMKTSHFKRTGARAPGFSPLDELLGSADFVSLHTPLNADSHGLMNAARIRAMKRGGFLINMARGKVVDEAALVAALQSGHLAGAALDVFEDEPKVHPALIRMENVVLTPHLGGGTEVSRLQARLLCASNVAAVLRGQSPLSPVLAN